MSNNKELVEKYENLFKTEAVYYKDQEEVPRIWDMKLKELSEQCAALASEHYGDKWISVEVIKPEYFVDVKGRLANLVEVICHYDDITECFMDDNGNIYDITHWQPQQ